MLLELEIALCIAPRDVRVWQAQLPAGARLQDAMDLAHRQWDLHCSGVAEAAGFKGPAAQSDVQDQAISLTGWEWGVWGRVLPPEHVLQAGDRVEAYRPLLVDPKVARRERFAKQGARGAGLFSKKRDNAKPGY